MRPPRFSPRLWAAWRTSSSASIIHARIPTVIKNDRWYEPLFGAPPPSVSHGATRRAIPTAELVGRVNDFGGWYLRSTAWIRLQAAAPERATTLAATPVRCATSRA